MVGVAFFVSSVSLFVFHIYLGRNLGPLGYGNLTYIMTVGTFLSLFYLLGLQPAIINIISPKVGRERKECITTTFAMVVLHFTVVSLVYLLLQNYISAMFRIDITLLKYSILYAVGFAFFNIIQAIMQAMQDMKSVSALKLISSVCLVASFFIVHYSLINLMDYRKVAGMKVIFLILAAIIIVIFKMRKELAYDAFNINTVRTLIHYSLYGFLLQLSAPVILEFTKVVLNMYYSAEIIGLFQVYTMSAVSIAQMMITAIVIVYFPVISKSNNKEKIVETIESYEKHFLLIFPINLITSYMFFKMYGRQYEMNIWTMMIFNIYVLFLFITSIHSRTVEAFGVQGVRVSLMVSLLGAGITLLLSFLLIPSSGINGAILTMTITRIVIYLAFRSHLRNKVRGKIVSKQF